MKIKLQNRLSVKLIISISLILIVVLAVHTYISVSGLTGNLTAAGYQNAHNLSDVIKKSIRYSMLLDRRGDVHQIIKTIGTEKGVRGIRIYNKQGIIIFSTDSSEINKHVDLSSEACIVCHKQSLPLKNLNINNKMRIFKDSNGIKVLGVINPIYNDKDCYTADCHVHESKVKMLGVLDVMISLKGLDEIISANTKSTITNSVLITILIALFCGLYITALVNRPIRKLLKGIEELGKGNLSYKIPIDSKGELGLVASRFNEMSGKLEAAYKEIEDWSENLNRKVRRKSEELQKIYKQVIQIEKLASLGKLSATVAHELNNPLEGILTYSKLINKKLKETQKDGEFAKLIEYLELISEESSRCGKIVKDLLLFSHKGESEYQRCDIVSVIEKCAKLIEHHLEIHRIKLVKEYGSDQAEVFINPQKIQQALMSVLINSIEAMPEGGNIYIKVNKEYDNLTIRISDEGLGISDKDLPHIFEPFYTTKEASKGTGLGLSVVYGIISHHDGFVEVENTSPRGTTFKISFPLKEK